MCQTENANIYIYIYSVRYVEMNP